jgi:hypothetical protein
MSSAEKVMGDGHGAALGIIARTLSTKDIANLYSVSQATSLVQKRKFESNNKYVQTKKLIEASTLKPWQKVQLLNKYKPLFLKSITKSGVYARGLDELPFPPEAIVVTEGRVGVKFKADDKSAHYFNLQEPGEIESKTLGEFEYSDDGLGEFGDGLSEDFSKSLLDDISEVPENQTTRWSMPDTEETKVVSHTKPR